MVKYIPNVMAFSPFSWLSWLRIYYFFTYLFKWPVFYLCIKALGFCSVFHYLYLQFLFSNLVLLILLFNLLGWSGHLVSFQVYFAFECKYLKLYGYIYLYIFMVFLYKGLTFLKCSHFSVDCLIGSSVRKYVF